MLNFVYLHLWLLVVYITSKFKILKIMKNNYCILALLTIFIILVFALNDVWQLIAFLLLVLLTLPVTVSVISEAVIRCQENKIKKSDNDMVDNLHQIAYAVKVAFIWIALLGSVIVFAGGFIATLVTVIGLFFDWCSFVLLIYALIYLTLVMLRTITKALFK